MAYTKGQTSAAFTISQEQEALNSNAYDDRENFRPTALLAGDHSLDSASFTVDGHSASPIPYRNEARTKMQENRNSAQHATSAHVIR